MTTTRKDIRLKTFQRQLERLELALQEMQQQDTRFFWLRLGTLLLGSLLVFLALFAEDERVLPAAIAVSVGAFAVVVYFHRRLDRSLVRFKLSRTLVLHQVARMRLDWPRIPSPASAKAEEQVSGEHPFAHDLNLIGERSLHRLLDTAISEGGSQRLLGWLLEGNPDPGRILERQALVRELAARSGFRSRLALNGALVMKDGQKRWDGERLVAWLEQSEEGGNLRRFVIILAGLAVLNALLLALNLARLLPPYWIISFTAYALLYMTKYREIGETFSDAAYLSSSLERFRAVLAHLERYPYRGQDRLSRLCAPFWQGQPRPSSYLRRAAGIASAASLQGNPFVWAVLNAAMPWDLYFAYRLQQTRAELRSRLPVWLDTWYELEALNSLANFAYLNPDYTFPEIIQTEEKGQAFLARDLGHPLIPDERRVCNDFQVDHLGHVAIITGSNMSGKSTFLRTLGANLCLAFAGGPVGATYLRTFPFRLFTSIQLTDSLSDGFSYFYAEVRRLKRLLEALNQPDELPLFFLIDEIFRGTNNRERQIGSQSYVEALVGRHGTGVISTHDLELVKLADLLPGVSNFHFREEVMDGRLVFDYRLRSGPSPTTNALKIMQLEGLPVDLPAERK